MTGSWNVKMKGLYIALFKRNQILSSRISASALYLPSPVNDRKCAAFHFNSIGAYVSG